VRCFQQVGHGIDVLPLLHQLQTQPELWNADRVRTTYPGTPHAEVDDILLRFNPPGTFEEVVDSRDCVNYPAFGQLVHALPIITALMVRVQGERLGRVIITRLPAGAQIAPHADEGAPATYYERYQLTLQAQPGVVFRAGDEQVFMEPGTIWWFDNKQRHSVENHSPDDRIAMIIDIRPIKLSAPHSVR